MNMAPVTNHIHMLVVVKFVYFKGIKTLKNLNKNSVINSLYNKTSCIQSINEILFLICMHLSTLASNRFDLLRAMAWVLLTLKMKTPQERIYWGHIPLSWWKIQVTSTRVHHNLKSLMKNFHLTVRCVAREAFLLWTK